VVVQDAHRGDVDLRRKLGGHGGEAIGVEPHAWGISEPGVSEVTVQGRLAAGGDLECPDLAEAREQHGELVAAEAAEEIVLARLW
jgi:hypothetical protein